MKDRQHQSTFSNKVVDMNPLVFNTVKCFSWFASFYKLLLAALMQLFQVCREYKGGRNMGNFIPISFLLSFKLFLMTYACTYTP